MLLYQQSSSTALHVQQHLWTRTFLIYLVVDRAGAPPAMQAVLHLAGGPSTAGVTRARRACLGEVCQGWVPELLTYTNPTAASGIYIVGHTHAISGLMPSRAQGLA